jgi:hypothetical protein
MDEETEDSVWHDINISGKNWESTPEFLDAVLDALLEDIDIKPSQIRAALKRSIKKSEDMYNEGIEANIIQIERLSS